MPIFPRLDVDDFGQRFLRELEALTGGRRLLTTDAPWFVRVRAWRPHSVSALVVHWINYRQAEEAAIEIPIPVDELRAECHLPAGAQVEKVEWLYPEMKAPVELDYTAAGSSVSFAIPRLIVYGMAVIHLQQS
jgi:hypothetical protein